MTLKDQVKHILAEKLGLEITDIDDQSLLSEDLGVDALIATDIINTIKEKTGIEVPVEEIKEVQTVEQLVALVEENSLE